MTLGGILQLRIKRLTVLIELVKPKRFLYIDLLLKTLLKRKFKRLKVEKETWLIALFQLIEISQNLLQWKILRIFSLLINKLNDFCEVAFEIIRCVGTLPQPVLICSLS